MAIYKCLAQGASRIATHDNVKRPKKSCCLGMGLELLRMGLSMKLGMGLELAMGLGKIFSNIKGTCER